MELNSPLTALLAASAVLLAAGLAYLARARRLRERRTAEMQTLRERPIVLRPVEPPEALALPFQENPEAVRFVALFTDMVKRLSGARSGDEVPSVLVRTLSTLIGASSVAYFAYDEGSRTLRLVQGCGLPPGTVGTLTVPLGKGKVGVAAQHQIVMEENDFARHDPLTKKEIQALPLPEIPTAFCAPLLHKERLYGLVSVSQPSYLAPHMKKLLAAVADLAAISLHNAHLLGRFAHQADTDALTGLSTRGSFAHHLAEEVVRSRNYGDPLSLLIVDVDHFKHYNDTNGHPAGDEVLRRVAETLRASFRKTDMVARYGGEEFVVVMSGLKKAQAGPLAERLRARMESLEFPHGARQPLGRVTISAGVATFPEDGPTGEELLRSADRALYDAKRAGRNRVVLYRPPELSSEEDAPLPAAAPERPSLLADPEAPAEVPEAAAAETTERGAVRPAPLPRRPAEPRPTSAIAPPPHPDEYWEA